MEFGWLQLWKKFMARLGTAQMIFEGIDKVKVDREKDNTHQCIG